MGRMGKKASRQGCPHPLLLHLCHSLVPPRALSVFMETAGKLSIWRTEDGLQPPVMTWVMFFKRKVCLLPDAIFFLSDV